MTVIKVKTNIKIPTAIANDPKADKYFFMLQNNTKKYRLSQVVRDGIEPTSQVFQTCANPSQLPYHKSR